MPPEEPENLVAINLSSENHNLICRGERVFPRGDRVKISWYTKMQATPENYRRILDGVAYAYEPSVASVTSFDDLSPTRIGDRYFWKDRAYAKGLMIAMVLPSATTILAPEPMPVEAKNFDERVALYWLIYPSTGKESEEVCIGWVLKEGTTDVDSEVKNINRAILLASKRDRSAEYDVALSYAGEDESYVDKVAWLLREKGVRVFYNGFDEQKAKLWGANLYDRLTEVYKDKATYTVMFISQHYANKLWPNHERQAAQARAFNQNSEYILPARFDNTEVPTLLPTISYIALSDMTPEELVRLILLKLGAT
jgi:hypothetical protein